MMRYFLILVVFTLISSCVKSIHPTEACYQIFNTVTYEEVKNLYKGALTRIDADLVIEGYITSSDAQGNFHGELFFQDATESPEEGFSILVEGYDTYLTYPVGQKVYIHAKGLYLGEKQGQLTLGGIFTGFGQQTVGRLPALKVSEHIIPDCEPPYNLMPLDLDIPELKSAHHGMLVRLTDVQFPEDHLGLPMAESEKDTERVLHDCNERAITLSSSGYADFFDHLLPTGSGSVIGVVQANKKDEVQIKTRTMSDLTLPHQRCPDRRMRSNSVIISEIADPDNDTKARFVELYNASDELVDLKDWYLARYTNANTEIGHAIDLSEWQLEGGKGISDS